MQKTPQRSQGTARIFYQARESAIFFGWNGIHFIEIEEAFVHGDMVSDGEFPQIQMSHL